MWYLQNEAEKPGKLNRIVMYLAEFWLVVLAVCMFLNWNSESEASSLDNALRGSYSDGVNAAAYIETEISNEEVLIVTDVPCGSTVMAYLKDYEFYYAGTGQKVYYADYSEEQEQGISVEALYVWAKDAFPDREAVYLLDSRDSCLSGTEKLQDFEVMYQTEEDTARGEEYTLYRVPIR